MAVTVSDIAGRLNAEFNLQSTAATRAIAAQRAVEDNIIPRVGIVDGSIVGNGAPFFKSFEEAVDWARSKVNDEGGEVLVKTYYDVNGDPINPDPSDYTWYTTNSNDDFIEYRSEIGSGGGGTFIDILKGNDVNLNDSLEDLNANDFTVDINLNG